VYYVYGDALAKIMREKLGIAVDSLPTQGPVHNVKLVESGGAQTRHDHNGGWPAGLEWHRRLDRRQANAGICAHCFRCTTRHFKRCLAQVRITSLAQLDKKRFGIGPRAAWRHVHPINI